jgi:hypothetical protein
VRQQARQPFGVRQRGQVFAHQCRDQGPELVARVYER